jgi:large subunit ribosomal protein L31e
MAENVENAPVKTEEKKVAASEQIYTIPLRDARNFPKWKKSNRAIKLIQEYLSKHMKVSKDNIRIDPELNEAIWIHGIQHPPSKIRVKATRSDDGMVNAEVVGTE